MFRRSQRFLIMCLALLVLSFGLFVSVNSTKAQAQFGSNWAVTYYPSTNFSGSPTVTRTEAAININWVGGSPDPSIPADNFSARFTGTQTFNQGTYTFTLTRDDGARVFLDGTLILNHTEGGLNTFQTTIAVNAGARNIVVEFIEGTGEAQISFSWQQVGVTGVGGTPGAVATGGTVTCGQTVSGTVPVGGSVGFGFAGNAGDVITVATNIGTPATLDPVTSIVSPTGTTLAENDDIVFGVNLNSLISGFTLPAAGAYTIAIRGFAGTGGTFTTTVSCTAAVVPVTAEVVSVRGLAVRSGPYLGATLRAVARPGIAYPVISRNNDEGIYTWYLLTIPIGQPQPTAASALTVTAIPGVIVPTAVAQQTTTGWSSGRYLLLTGDPNRVPVASSIFDQIDGAPDVGILAVTRAPMNFRRRPSVRTGVLTQIPWGGVAPVIGRTRQDGNDFWYQVRYDNQVGWIFAPYITIRGDINNVPIR